MLEDIKIVNTIKEAIIESTLEINNRMVWLQLKNEKVLFLNGKPSFKFDD